MSTDRLTPEIEISQDAILIRRPVTADLAADLRAETRRLFTLIADDLCNARSPYDGEMINGEAAYLAALETVGRAIEKALRRISD